MTVDRLIEAVENIETMLTIMVIVGVPTIIWFIINMLIEQSAKAFYAHLEERKKQKEYDKWLTNHEERYGSGEHPYQTK